MNANIMNTHFFHKIKYDLNRSHKAFLAKLFRAHSFNLPTDFDKKIR